MAGVGLTLDTIISSVFFHAGKQSPTLLGNQSLHLLRLILSKMWFPCHGNLFNGRLRVSHAALAAEQSLSRGWTCTMLGRVCDEGWLKSSAPRLPDGKQESSIFQIGPKLQWLLTMLLKSHQRFKNNRVNDAVQKLPTKEQIEKNKAFLADLIDTVGKKMAERTPKRGR